MLVKVSTIARLFAEPGSGQAMVEQVICAHTWMIIRLGKMYVLEIYRNWENIRFRGKVCIGHIYGKLCSNVWHGGSPVPSLNAEVGTHAVPKIAEKGSKFPFSARTSELQK
jgi:hypothetical protein